jgi:hypothetical protein
MMYVSWDFWRIGGEEFEINKNVGFFSGGHPEENPTTQYFRSPQETQSLNNFNIVTRLKT